MAAEIEEKSSGEVSLKLNEEVKKKRKKPSPRTKLCGKSEAIEDMLKNQFDLQDSMIITPRALEWWERPVIKYAFNHPHVRSRLERVMGSNVVRLTDRDYMLKLQGRINEDIVSMQQRRIRQREAEEVEREKMLVLEGKIPVEEASKELKRHPAFRVSRLTKKMMDEKKRKAKYPPLSALPSYYYDVDVRNARDGEPAAVLGISAGRDSSTSVAVTGDDCFLDYDDVSQGFMYTPEQYCKLKYESPLVQELRKLETVDELYSLADEIIGTLKTLKRGVQCGKQ
ncbi:uncharacterized protein [Periplaneta americana]|uniref:uncharacterized protein n=1 Tax=Periplaneta americana TaxID=6978 RepID=UPI0037E9148F